MNQDYLTEDELLALFGPGARFERANMEIEIGLLQQEVDSISRQRAAALARSAEIDMMVEKLAAERRTAMAMVAGAEAALTLLSRIGEGKYAPAPSAAEEPAAGG